MNREFWNKKRVFLTGHTGFKGGWLALWLADMGAEVYGYSLKPNIGANLYTSLKLEKCLAKSTFSNILDFSSLSDAMNKAQPEIVIHMAAQPIVRKSYAEPVETFSVNVMGTINVLEAVRSLASVKAVVNITTDKCYKNRDWVWPYRENDELGGADPYSSSKACSELISTSYGCSFLEPLGIQIATARAGNVIGGGDWSIDRIIPDFFRAVDEGDVLYIRSPQAIRPWQHVLEPLSGYLTLAENLIMDGKKFAGAWNFGPDENDTKSVEGILNYLISKIPNATWQLDTRTQLHEANTLKLDSTKSKSHLKWRPRWNLEKALDLTLSWHFDWKKNLDMAGVSLKQISEYESAI